MTIDRPINRYAAARRGGNVMLYLTGGMVMLTGTAAVAIDFGRAQLEAGRLQAAVDASTLAAADGLQFNADQARRQAAEVAMMNSQAGDDALIEQAEFVFGDWDEDARTFTPHFPDDSRADAVRITVRNDAETAGGVKTMFAGVFGDESVEVVASSTAQLVRHDDVSLAVPSTSNIWLAGMPTGTKSNHLDVDPTYVDKLNAMGQPVLHDDTDNAAPSEIPLDLFDGSVLEFNSIAGEMNHGRYSVQSDTDGDGDVDDDDVVTDYGQQGYVASTMYSADGNPDAVTHMSYPVMDDGSNPEKVKLTDAEAATTGEHGKSNIKAPINAMIGVFLGDDELPFGRSHAVPPMLDFSTHQSRNFTRLAPQLNQTFFIGDGTTDTGRRQQFVVPEGATRLFVGSMDGYQWNNNGGGYNTYVRRPAQVLLVD